MSRDEHLYPGERGFVDGACSEPILATLIPICSGILLKTDVREDMRKATVSIVFKMEGARHGNTKLKVNKVLVMNRDNFADAKTWLGIFRIRPYLWVGLSLGHPRPRLPTFTSNR